MNSEPFVTDIALMIHAVTGTWYFTLYAAVVVTFLLLFEQRKSALIFAAALTATSLAVWITKRLFVVPRPEGALIELSSYAFPSGHAAISFSVAVTGAWLLSQHSSFSRRAVYGFTFLFTLTALLVSYSRVVIGVHTWFQVLGGAIVGTLVPLVVVRLMGRFAADDRS
jgi:membrane-associated phospholipid phosphatase